MKMFQKLTPENRQFIEKNKWPPDWYDMSFVLSNHIFVNSDMLGGLLQGSLKDRRLDTLHYQRVPLWYH